MNSKSTESQLFFEDFDINTEKKYDLHELMLEALDCEAGPAWPDRFGSNLRSWFEKSNHQPIPTLSLFSGGGGLDIAFHDAGFNILEMVEIEEQFAATLQSNAREGGLLGGGTVSCVDIRNYEPPTDMQVEFIIGGPPCQTFSAAGRRAAGVKGTNDPRGTLFEEYVRIVKQLRPSGFLFENVYGITGAEGGEPWREIQQSFREAGYQIQWRVLDAADFGTPQHRERLFIVGIREGAGEYLFPFPTHGPDAITPRSFYTAGEAVRGSETMEVTSLSINGRWGHLIPGIPPGLNYSFYTAEMGHPNPVFAWRSKFSDFMYKADPLAPVRTIKAQGGLYTGPFSWDNRHFSVAELKRLQTFPDHYRLVGRRQSQIHQIGNSVPPQLGRILALSITNQLFKTELPFPMHYLPDHRTLGFRTRKRFLTEQYALKAKAAIARIDENSQLSRTHNYTQQESVQFLTSNFALNNDERDGGIPIHIRYEYDGEIVNIDGKDLNCTQSGETNYQYAIHIKPAPGATWAISLKKATLRGEGKSRLLFTALWKALEGFISNLYGIDDLVQLSGYYQYSPKMHAYMEIADSNEPMQTELRVLCQVVQRTGVAVQLTPSDMGQLWEVSESEAISCLHILRCMGYEVRSHNTNPQIKPSEYLIPYAFPTLTPRSVQLRKKL